MTENLLKAIYSRFTTPVNDFYTAVSGRLEYGIASDSWSDNFATYQTVNIDQDDCFRQTRDDVYFQFNLFSTSRSTCWDLLAKCQSLYDRITLAVTGHHPVLLHRNNKIPPIWDEEENLWQATIEFRCKLQPT